MIKKIFMVVGGILILGMIGFAIDEGDESLECSEGQVLVVADGIWSCETGSFIDKTNTTAEISEVTGWNKSGTNVYLSTTTDYVGIGTTSPSSRLHVEGTANISSLTIPTLSSCDTIDTDVNGTLKCGTDGGGTSTSSDGNETLIISNECVGENCETFIQVMENE